MKKIFRYLMPYKGILYAALILVLLQTIGDLYLPRLNADIIDKGVMMGDTGMILRTGGRMLLVAFLSVMCAISASYLASKSAAGFGKLTRRAIFERVEEFSLSELEQFGTSTLITRTTNDITQIQMVIIMAMRMMVVAPIMAVGGTIMALSQDRPLTLVLAVAIPILMLFVIFVAGKVIPLFKLIQKKVDRINLVLREKLSGVRVIRAFGTEEYEAQRFDEANEDLTQTFMKANRIMAFVMPAVTVIMSFTQVAIIWFGSIRIGDGNMQIGSLTAFIQYSMHIMMAFLMMSMMFVMIPRARAAAIRVMEVINTKTVINDPQIKNEEFLSSGRLEFRNVTFRYDKAEEPTLKDISFETSPGEITALIGSTGSGKSTLANLIPRFYDIEKGQILIDGVDIREMSQETLRNKIGFVPQKPVLFSGTVKENIMMGNENATEEEIKKAALVAQAEEFINEMKEGYEHIIDQGGVNISGGQKQRLSIARALVRRPEIYVFDDSFSALDFKTDAKLRDALRKEIKEASVIIIAQRVGTVMNAERIIVLNEGKIEGIGRHNELMKTCEVYQQIVSSQLDVEVVS